MPLSKNETIKIAVGSHWRTLDPTQQHTLIGDLVMSNQFDALVGFDERGLPQGLLAEKWDFNDNYTRLTFFLKKDLKFSDGSPVTADDVVRTWKEALQGETESSNNPQLDVLYKTISFDRHSLPGVKVLDPYKVELRFETPFRMAVEHLQGVRFAPVKKSSDGSILGTGRFLLSQDGPNKVALQPSPAYADHFHHAPMSVEYLEAQDMYASLMNGRIHLFAYAKGADIPKEIEQENLLTVRVGSPALHECLWLNNLSGRVLNERKLRQALQYLFVTEYQQNPSLLGNPHYSFIDPQIYLPLQQGHLTDAQEVKSLIHEGEKYVADLVKASQEHPLIVFYPKEKEFILDLFKKWNIRISKNSKAVTPQERAVSYYKGHEADIYVAAFSVAFGDPDGIYHLLGKNGAIASPLVYNKNVAHLLEEGRKLTKKESIDRYYQKVSRAVLEEVPIVHLGYSNVVAVYRNDLIEADSHLIRRNDGHFHVYRWK